MFKRMIVELDEFMGGLKKHLLTKFIQAYSAGSLALLFAYAIHHWLFKELCVVVLIAPIFAMIVGLPMLWYLDIKPMTDKKGIKKEGIETLENNDQLEEIEARLIVSQKCYEFNNSVVDYTEKYDINKIKPLLEVMMACLKNELDKLGKLD